MEAKVRGESSTAPFTLDCGMVAMEGWLLEREEQHRTLRSASAGAGTHHHSPHAAGSNRLVLAAGLARDQPTSIGLVCLL
jgi:hypothetical protein